jgi:hypothetical protein
MGRSCYITRRQILFFLRDPDVGVFAEAFPIHLAVQSKEFSGIGMESTQSWRHRSPWYPSDCGVELESFDESLVDDRKDGKAYVEHLVE